jgi:hypothetical protein
MTDFPEQFVKIILISLIVKVFFCFPFIRTEKTLKWGPFFVDHYSLDWIILGTFFYWRLAHGKWLWEYR